MTLAASSTAQNFWRYVQEQGYFGSINDQLSKLLTAEGYSGPTPSSLYSLLGSLGYTGTLNERINSFEREYTIRYGNTAAWSPLALFAAAEAGVWYDPSDLSTMFQDSTGTTPVTATGQTVGLILDKSQNATLGAEKNTAPYTATGTGWSSTESSISKVLNGSNATGQLTSCESPTAGRWYQVSFTASGLSGGTCYVRYGNSTSASTALSVRVSTAGNYTFLLLATSAAAKLQFIAYEGTDFAVTFTNISIKEITGNHAYQANAGLRPKITVGSGLYWLLDDLVDDSIAATVPSLGTSATVAYAEDGVTTILTAQTIGAGTLTLPDTAKIYGYIAVNRALTAAETVAVTAYLDAKRGA